MTMNLVVSIARIFLTTLEIYDKVAYKYIHKYLHIQNHSLFFTPTTLTPSYLPPTSPPPS